MNSNSNATEDGGSRKRRNSGSGSKLGQSATAEKKLKSVELTKESFNLMVRAVMNGPSGQLEGVHLPEKPLKRFDQVLNIPQDFVAFAVHGDPHSEKAFNRGFYKSK